MRWAILIGIIISVGCGRSDSSTNAPAAAPAAIQAKNDWPTLVVDSVHQLHNENSPSKPYFVPAAGGLNLQVNGFEFRDPKNLSRVPNAVRVLYLTSVYISQWEENANQIFTLDQSTLKTLKGVPFAGFAIGKRAFVAIGFQDAGKSSDDGFTPFWIGSVIFH